MHAPFFQIILIIVLKYSENGLVCQKPEEIYSSCYIFPDCFSIASLPYTSINMKTRLPIDFWLCWNGVQKSDCQFSRRVMLTGLPFDL